MSIKTHGKMPHTLFFLRPAGAECIQADCSLSACVSHHTAALRVDTLDRVWKQGLDPSSQISSVSFAVRA